MPLRPLFSPPGRIRVFFLLAILATSSPAAAPGPAPLIKVGEFRLKHARMAAAAVPLGDHIYVFGGSATGAVTFVFPRPPFGAVTVVERFNVHTHEVEELSRDPRPRRHHEAVEHHGKIFLFGGQGFGLREHPHEQVVEVYDPATNQVTQAAVWTTPRTSAAAVKIGDKAWFFGGSVLKGTRRAQVNTTEAYDFTTGQWTEGPPMPTPRESEAAQVDAFVLIPGGYRGLRGTSQVEMFVPSDGSWRTLPPLPRLVSAHSLAFLGEHLFLFGDFDRLDQIVAYNLRTRESVIFKAGLRGVRHSAAVVSGERIYIIGGDFTEAGDERDYIQVFALNPDYPATK